MTDMQCTPCEAVARGRSAVGAGGHYQLGSGDFYQGPWNSTLGSDCAGFAISWAWKLIRHRPGFNIGSWASVSDDINVNSAIEDGQHKHELFDTLAPGSIPRPGDLLCYPTFRVLSQDGHPLTFIGHVGLVEDVPDDYKPGEGWHRLSVLQCHGPNGFTPAVVRTDGAVWDHHDSVWPLPQHHTVLVRPKTRT